MSRIISRDGAHNLFVITHYEQRMRGRVGLARDDGSRDRRLRMVFRRSSVAAVFHAKFRPPGSPVRRLLKRGRVGLG